MIDTVLTGSLLLAVPIAMLAGLVSFASPCVLPLAPGYLAYVTGLTGADLAAQPPRGLGATSSPSVVLRQAQEPVETTAPAVVPSSPSVALRQAQEPVETTAPARRPIGTRDGASGGPEPTVVSTSSTDGSGASTDGLGRETPARGRVVLGALLFVLGFSAVFVSYGLLFGGLGSWLLTHQRAISAVLGVVTIVLGLGFIGLPGIGSAMWFNRERRSGYRPARGLWGAPVLGIGFGLGWTPCIGPTLAAVQTLAFTEASAARGAVLSLAYCLGLGLPFVLLAAGLRWSAGLLGWTRRHHRAISTAGGAMLVLVGILLVTGWWGQLVVWLQSLAPGFTVVV